MEKIAKKTAEEKKEASQKIEKAEEMLDSSHELGADTEDAEKLIEEARKLLEERELDDCLEKVDEGLELLRNSNRERVEELIDKIKDLHEIIGDEERYEGSFNKLGKTEELMGEDRFKEALGSASDALELAQLEVQEKLTDEFTTVDSMILILEEKDEDTADIQEKLDKARNSLEDDDYLGSSSLVDDCKEMLKTELNDFADEGIKKTENLQKIVRNSGGKTTDSEELLNKAKTSLNEGDFERTISLTKEARTLLDDELTGVVSKGIEELEGELENARELECDVQKVLSLKEDIVGLIEEEKNSEAYEKLDEAFEKLDEVKFQKVLRTIADSRENFIKAKEIGIDINEPMKLLTKARNSLKQGDHREAIDWAKKGRTRVRELVEEHENAEMMISEAKSTFGSLQEIDMELEEAEKILDAAEEALQDRNYNGVHEKLEEFDGYIDKHGYEKVMTLIEEMEGLILIAEDMGFDVNEYNEKLEVAIANTKSGEYAEAGKIAIESSSEIEDMIKEELASRMDNLEDLISRIKEEVGPEEGVKDLEDVESSLEEIEVTYNEGRFRDAYEKLNSISEDLKRWRVGEAEEHLNHARDLVDLLDELEKHELDIEEFRNKVREAEQSFENDDYSSVIQDTEEIIKTINSHIEQTAEEVFAEAKREVVKAKKAGVKIEHMRKKLIECKKKIRGEGFVEGIQLSIKVREEAERLRKKRKESYELLTSMSNKIKEIKDKGEIKDLSPVRNLLLKAKSSFQTRDYTQAENLTKQAEKKIKELKEKESFENKVSFIRDMFSEANSLGIDTSDSEKIITDIISESKEMDKEESEERLDELEKNIISTMKDLVEPEIEKTEDIINSAKEIGVDVSKPEEMLSSAKSLFDDNEFKESIDVVKECQSLIETIKNRSKKAAGSVRKVKMRIEDAKDLDADVSKPESYLDKAIKALKSNKYEEAIEQTKKALDSIEEAEMVRVYDILQNFQEKIVEARKQGINTAFADNLIKRAEKAMDDGKYREAINLAMQSEGELERVELQQNIAKRSISTTQSKIKEARDQGIKVGNAGKLLEHAKKAYKGGFYVKAFDNAVKSGDELKQINKAYEDMEELMEGLEEGHEAADGLDIGEEELKKKLQDIGRSVKRGRYDKALENAKEARDIFESIGKQLPDILEDVEGLVDSFEEEGKETGDARDLLGSAKEAIKRDDIKKACESIKKAKEEVGGDVIEEYEKYMEESRNLINTAKKFGAPVQEAASMLDEAESISEEDIEKACEKAKEALERIEKALEPYSPKIKVALKGRLEKDDWNETTVKIMNTGGGVAKSPTIEFSGAEAGKIELPAMLKAGEEIERKVKVKPTDEAVVVTGIGTRIFDDKELECTLEIYPGEDRFKIKKARGDEKCSVCEGDIKKGLDLIVCGCGEELHKSCAEKVGECPDCGSEFELKKKKKASKRVALRI